MCEKIDDFLMKKWEISFWKCLLLQTNKIEVKFMEMYKELKLYSRYKSAFVFGLIVSAILTILAFIAMVIFLYKTNTFILYISIVIMGINLLFLLFSFANLKCFLTHQKRYLSLLMREENSWFFLLSYILTYIKNV